MSSDEAHAGGRTLLGGSILDAVSSHQGPQHGGPPPEGEEAQMGRILSFLERWLSEPVLSAVLLEHRGAGEREVLDTVLVKTAADAAYGPSPLGMAPPPASGVDDDDEAGEAAEAALEARARRICDGRPAAAEVAHRFGLKIGEHAPRLQRGDHPRYVLVAQAAAYPGQLAQCEVWAEVPAHAYGRGGGAAGLVALRAVPGFDRGPLLRAPSLMDGHGGAATQSTTYAAEPIGQSVADVRTEATSAGLVRVLTRHIDQIMKTQGKTMDASLGAMAALNDKLLERTHLLESQHTETLKMQHELHRKWLQAESDRVRSETLAGVEADIQRAKNAQEKAKGDAFNKAVDILRPAAAALTAKFQGADLVMRFVNSFPEGALEMMWPMLSAEQQAMLQHAAELDDAMMQAIERARRGTTNVALGAALPEGHGGAQSAAPDTPASPPPPARYEHVTVEPVTPVPATVAQTSVEAERHAEADEEPPAPVAQRRPPTTDAQQEPASSCAAPPSHRFVYAQCSMAPRSPALSSPAQRSATAPRRAIAAAASGEALDTRVSGQDGVAPSQPPASGAAPATEAPAETSASPVFIVRGALPSPVTLSAADSEAVSLPDPRQTDLPFEAPSGSSSSTSASSEPPPSTPGASSLASRGAPEASDTS